MREANKYISALHKKQKDPLEWPDFLTGLPDKAATIRKATETHAKLGRYKVTCFRINNINAYMAKHGTDKHVEIVEWAAAILATTADGIGGFIGTLDTHEFLSVMPAGKNDAFVEKATKLFNKKVEIFYKPKELKNGSTLSFSDKGKQVKIGLMELVHLTAGKDCDVKAEDFVTHIRNHCA